MAEVGTETAEKVSPPLEAQPLPRTAKRALAPLAVIRPLATVAGRFFGPSNGLDNLEPVERPRSSKYFVSFIALVVVPSLFVSLYFALIASDQYSAEARFAVTTSKLEMSDKLEKLRASLSGVPSSTTQDVYIISAYIHSRAIVEEISRTLDLREIFRRPEADFWARLRSNAKLEELTEYWQSMVGVYVDPPSGIVTVSVRAFRRDDAVRICQAIVKAGEELANSVSTRAQQYTMKLAESEVARAEKRVVSSLADLRQFREQAGFIDPTSQAKATGSILTDLLSEKIKLQNEYFVSSRAMSTSAPTVQTMKARLDSLDGQIAQLRAKLTGNSSEAETVASLMPKYEALELQNRFAEKIFDLTQDGLERARLRAEAQSIYVNAFEPPALPEEAEYPQRLFNSISLFAVLTILWGIGAMIFAVVEDHRI